MNRNRWLFAAGITVAVVLIGTSAVVGAGPVPPTTGGDGPLTGETRDKAVAAAVAHVGGGDVTDTEVGDDGAFYGVEVRQPDGTQVEVNLDQAYAVTGTEADDDGPGDDDDDEPDDDADDVNDNDGPNDPDDDPGEPASDPND
jgi:hypothetical protein